MIASMQRTLPFLACAAIVISDLSAATSHRSIELLHEGLEMQDHIAVLFSCALIITAPGHCFNGPCRSRADMLAQ